MLRTIVSWDKRIVGLHGCYGSTATMETKELCNNSKTRKYFKFIFGMNILCHNTYIMNNIVAREHCSHGNKQTVQCPALQEYFMFIVVGMTVPWDKTFCWFTWLLWKHCYHGNKGIVQ